MTYYLAIDIGASSGRHILGHLEKGKLCTEEIWRFDNHLKKTNEGLVWDTDSLLSQVKLGIAKCKELKKIPKTVAIDTWGVDYVLLDENKKELFPAFSYRDNRTEKAPEEVHKILSQKALYGLCGIQMQNFNTVYQLWCDKKSGKLSKARHFLMMPEYLSFKLCGVMANEYTNATTGGFVNANTKGWDKKVLETLGISEDLFLPPSLPGTCLGSFTKEVQQEVGFDAKVLLAPSHDTASAVAAIPTEESCAYISSGTWSLLGTENKEPQLGEEARKANFINEGGVEYRFRFLKNIMGMWLFQGIRRDLDKALSYDEMMHLAMESDFKETFDPNASELVAPGNMTEAIRHLLNRPDLPLKDVLSSVYHSLAVSYRDAIREIEHICQKNIQSIYIVGGGSRDSYLNRLTARYTKKSVQTGLTEATATGNLLSQIMQDHTLSLNEAREIIKLTFPIKEVKNDSI